MMSYFEDEITALLDRCGLGYTVDSRISCRILSVGVPHAGSGTVRTVKIILIPLVAASPDQARKQSLAIRPLAGCRDTLSITEDRWMKSRGMMRRRLLAHLGIFRSVYARDCEVRKINRTEADSFLERTHSYGGAKCRYCYGIFLKRERVKTEDRHGVKEGTGIGAGLASGTMIAAAEFSNARRWIKDGKEIRSYEWIRYASLPDVRISGGMGKVLKRFAEDVSPDDIMSYADLEWSDGQAYQKLGFIHDGDKSPVTFVISTVTWQRIPVKETRTSDEARANDSEIFYFQNFGSRKYRLRLY